MGARKEEKRNALWVWTAVVEERDGSRGIDFEVGGRDESTFLRLLERLPDAERYETDAYGVYGALPVNKHRLGKGGVVNRRGIAFGIARQVEPSYRGGYSKTAGMLTLSLAPAWLKLGWLQYACTCLEYPLAAITFKLMRHLLYLFGFGGGVSRANRGYCP